MNGDSSLFLLVVFARRTTFFHKRSAQFFKNACVLVVNQQLLFKHMFGSLSVDRFLFMIAHILQQRKVRRWDCRHG